MSVKFQRRNNRYKRPGYKACGRMVYGDARKALVIAKSVKRLINVEVKNFDTQNTLLNLTQTPVIIQLFNIPVGDTTNSRDGAQCKVIGIEFNYFLNANTTEAPTRVRIMMILDKQTNQAIYANDDVLQDVTGSDNIVSPRNLNNKHRFQVLLDRTHMLTLASSSVVVKRYIRKDILLRFDASTPSIADLTQNSISLLVMTSLSTNVPQFTHFTRLRYVDN